MGLPATLVKIGEDPAGKFAWTQELTATGCLFLYDESIGVDVPVEMAISLLDGRSLRTRGKVSLERQAGDAIFEVHVDFEEFPSHEVLLAGPAGRLPGGNPRRPADC